MGTAACVVAVPMMGRHWAAAPLAESLAASVDEGQVRLEFVVNHDDPLVIDVCAATGADVRRVEWSAGPGDYARKINASAADMAEEWIFTAASDLVFHPGWLDVALRVADDMRGVVGTNDLGNSLVRAGKHSTHSLVHRDYVPTAVIDQPGNLYCTLYDHNYCDMEFVDYAKHRGLFRPARRSVVEHMHPDWRKGVMDVTYERGKGGFRTDQLLWHERQLLWRPPSPQQRQRERMEARRRARAARRV
jgi:hypothetical protein